MFLDSVIAQELLGPCEGTGLFRALLAPLTLACAFLHPPSLQGLESGSKSCSLLPWAGLDAPLCLPPCPLCSFPWPHWSPRHGGHPKGTMRPRQWAWGNYAPSSQICVPTGCYRGPTRAPEPASRRMWKAGDKAGLCPLMPPHSLAGPGLPTCPSLGHADLGFPSHKCGLFSSRHETHNNGGSWPAPPSQEMPRCHGGGGCER